MMHCVRASVTRERVRYPLVLAVLIGSSSVSWAQGEKFNPFSGIDRNNRIEKPKLPADLPHPERWRYMPEGRIKPGNVFDRFLVTTFISPLFFREEDIGFGGGFALTDIDFRNQGGREFVNIQATASEEGQQRFRFNWNRWLDHRRLDGGGYIRDERNRVQARAEYSRTLTRRFFGFGSRTRTGNETSYTEELAVLSIGSRLSVPTPAADVLLNFGASFEHHGLQRGRVSSVPSTDAAFPVQFADGDGVDQLWLGAGIAYDVRDSLHQPYSGWRVGAGVDFAPAQTGLDPGAVFRADVSGAFAVPPLFHEGGDADEDNPPTDTIAFSGFGLSTAGELPFYRLPSLGGASTLRGYIQNRFTDRVALHGSVEYRFVVVPRGIRFTDTIRIERIGAALFYDFGTVSRDLSRITTEKYRDSYGIGMRASLAREAVFRFDLGFSAEDSNLSIAFGHPF